MNTDKAISRLRLLGKRIMIWGSVVGIAFWVWIYIVRGGGGLFELFLLVGASVVFGGILWLIAWILEP
jgi:hypothetical protein